MQGSTCKAESSSSASGPAMNPTSTPTPGSGLARATVYSLAFWCIALALAGHPWGAILAGMLFLAGVAWMVTA